MKLEAQKIEAKRISLKVKENYFQALTAIFNNWRDDRRIYHVANDTGNMIYVTVSAEAEMDAITWLASFGEVFQSSPVLVALVDSDQLCDFDTDKYCDFIIAVQ